MLDVAGEFAGAGERRHGVGVAEPGAEVRRRSAARPDRFGPDRRLQTAELLDRRGDCDAAAAARRRAGGGDRTWAFPSRLEDVAALEAALAADPEDATAAALLGHWLYAHGRPADAIARWEASLGTDPTDPVVWRNLGVALVNTADDGVAAMAAYQRALGLAPADGRLWYEADQLHRRLGATPADRLQRLETGDAPLRGRDDLAVEYAHLLLSADRLGEAIDLLHSVGSNRGRVARVWSCGPGTRRDAAGARFLATGSPDRAVAHLEQALTPPDSLGEARHPLANPAQLLLLAGDAYAALDDVEQAAHPWRRAARTWATSPGWLRSRIRRTPTSRCWRPKPSATGSWQASSPTASPVMPSGWPRPRRVWTTSPPRCRTCCCSRRTRSVAGTCWWA